MSALAVKAGRALRIAVLTSEYAPYAWGGLATYLQAVVPLLERRGSAVDVIVAPTYARGVARAPAGASPPMAVLEAADEPAAQLAALPLDAWWDVAYVQDAQLVDLATLMLRTGRCARLVAAAHLPSYAGFSYFDTPTDQQRQHEAEAVLFRHATAIVAPSEFAADLLQRVHRVRPVDVIAIPLGSPPRVPAREPEERERLALVSVGRIARQKGLLDMCELAGELASRGFVLRHVGAATDERHARALAGAGIVCLGQRDQAAVLWELTCADVLVSTSHHETFGLSVIEAQAAGAVPVAFACGSLPALVESGRSGVLTPIGDVGALVEAIVRLDGDRAALREMRSAAITSAARFSWERHVDALLEVLA